MRTTALTIASLAFVAVMLIACGDVAAPGQLLNWVHSDKAPGGTVLKSSAHRLHVGRDGANRGQPMKSPSFRLRISS